MEMVPFCQSLIGCVRVCMGARSDMNEDSCPTLCDSMDYSPPGFSVHGILQAAILEWVAMSSSRGSSPAPGVDPSLLHYRWVLYCGATREVLCMSLLGRKCGRGTF